MKLNSIIRLSGIFIAFLFIICSCKNDDETYKLIVKGKVTDYYTGKGIAYAKVYVKDVAINPGVEQIRNRPFDTTKIIGKITADSEGNFNKTFEVEKGSYKVFVYDCLHISPDAQEINQDFNSELNIKAKSFTKIKITFTNKNKLADSLLFTFDYSPSEFVSIIHDDFIITGDWYILEYGRVIPETTWNISYILYMSEDLKKIYPYHFSFTQNIAKTSLSEIAIEY